MASVGSSGFEFSESGVSEDAGRLLLLCKPQTPREMINRRYGRANSRLAVTQATEREHFLKRRLNTEWSLNNVPQVHHRERNLKVWSETGTKISCFRFKFHLLHVGLSNFQPKHVPGSWRQTSTGNTADCVNLMYLSQVYINLTISRKTCFILWHHYKNVPCSIY